jgi:hypothetical protein
MKSILKFIAVIAILFSTSVSLAKEPTLLFTNSEDSRSMIFRLDTPSRETAIRFFDNLGNTIYSEKTGAVLTYGKKFDLKKLESGLYFLEVEDAFKEIVYTIKVSKSDVNIVKKDEKLKPVFRMKGNKLFLNLLNLKEADVEIKVLDSSNRVLFQEVIKGEMVVEKAINFENAFDDSYTVVVKNGSKTYYENVLVD